MSTKATNSYSLTRAAALAPAAIVAMTVTELFFKFGSFTLELVGCAVVFAGLYGIQTLVAKALKK